ncbi:MAG: hypothetical protein HGA87_00300 [Desulfobulbaceae bacterium]|nr:hypothetical protein [Desulfobulbaceae bacterium]
MAGDNNINSSNSVIILTIPGLYTGVQIQGFSTDNIFSSEDVEMAEIMMGADGKLSAAFVPNPTPMVITLQADSPSNEVFDFWARQQKTNRTLYKATMIVTISSISKSYVCSNGFFQKSKVMPDAAKVLQPRPYTIVFESIVPMSI